MSFKAAVQATPGLTNAYQPGLVWISSGKTTFTKTSPAARRLAGKGVLAAGSHYTIR